VEVEAAALERLGQLAGGVGGQHDERPALRNDRAELRDGDLEVGEHFQQQALDLDVGLVGLVDEQHGRLGAPDGLEQWPGKQELLGEDVAAFDVPAHLAGVPVDLQAEQLLAVVPLVQGPGLVDPLVALQPDQPGAGDRRDCLGQLGLAHAGGPLDEQRLAEPVGEEDGRRGRRIGQVADPGEPLTDLGRGAEQWSLHNSHRPLPGRAALRSRDLSSPTRPDRTNAARRPVSRVPPARRVPGCGSAGYARSRSRSWRRSWPRR
jgi:hypothetical protein